MILALFLIAYRLMNYDIDYSMLVDKNNLGICAVLSLLYAIHLIILPISWKLIIGFLGYKQIPLHELQTVFCKSNLMKYIPGNIMQYVGRNEIAVMYNLNHARIAFSTVLDIIANVVGVGIVALLCYHKGIKIFLDKYSIAWKIAQWVLLGGIVITGMVIFLFGKKVKSWLQVLDLKKYILCIFIYSFFAFYTAGIYVLIIRLVLKVDIVIAMLPTVIGAYLLSWLLGFLLPGAPGGVGIREAAITLFLGGFLQNEIILLAIVIYRIINTVGDVLAYIFCLIRNCLCKRNGDYNG